MSDALGAVALRLDRLRCAALALTLRWPLGRYLFRRRIPRHACIFALAFTTSLLGASVVPWLLLAAGPIIYGLPHLASSLRYGGRLQFFPGSERSSGAPFAAKIGLVFVTVMTLRVSMAVWAHFDLNLYDRMPKFVEEVLRDNRLELGGALLCLIVAVRGILEWRQARYLLAFVALAVLGGCSLRYPEGVMAVLAIGHNFVAFAFWWLAARRDERARRLVYWCFAAFTMAHVAIFSGYFDHVPQFLFNARHQSLAGLAVSDLGSTLIPWSFKPQLWQRAVRAYAFGQSLHYVLWLRLIPEQHLPGQVPISFRSSLKLLGRDFGVKSAQAIIVLCVLGVTAWLGALSLSKFALARDVYFAAASFHGYFEIAGLLMLCTHAGLKRELF